MTQDTCKIGAQSRNRRPSAGKTTTKATTSGTSRSKRTLRTVLMATPSQDAKRSKTSSSPIIPNGSRTTCRQLIQTVRSNFPPSLHLALRDCELLLFVDHNPGLAYNHWPKDYQDSRVMTKLRKRRWVKRLYFPTRFSMTRSGYSIVSWIVSAIEHATAKSRAAEG